MKASEVTVLTDQEIGDKIRELKDELFNLRFQAATAQLENVMRIREVRRSIARLKTAQRMRELGREV